VRPVVVGRVVGRDEPPVAGTTVEAVAAVGLLVVVPTTKPGQALQGGGAGVRAHPSTWSISVCPERRVMVME